MPKIESENQFLTPIKGRKSVLICQIYPSAIPGHSFPISALIASLKKIGLKKLPAVKTMPWRTDGRTLERIF